MSLARAGLGLALLRGRGACFGLLINLEPRCPSPLVRFVGSLTSASSLRSQGFRQATSSHAFPLSRSSSTSFGALPPRPRLFAPGLVQYDRLKSRLYSSTSASANGIETQGSLHESSPAAKGQKHSSGDESRAQGVTSPVVAYHLFFCAALVYLIIVVGGLTRLTESGLSITEWNPGFKGMRLPLTDAEWDEEWEKYKRTPEWAVLNQHMSVDDFKKIYMWEWSHRIIGRLIGVVFVLPAFFFLARGRVAPGSRWKIWAIAGGIGFQGALGWFMVKSGLTAPEATPPALSPTHPNSTAETGAFDPRLDGHVSADGEASTSSDWHPRVSHFRLAAHLGTAFAVYLGMLHTGMAILRDHKIANAKGKVGGMSMQASSALERLASAMQNSRVARFRSTSRAMLILTFVTAMSGALVAGLDAGLVYSEFPYMGDRLVPPRDELLDSRYTWGGADKDVSDIDRKTPSGRLIVGNFSQNPVSVQLMHRCLAVTTFFSAIGLGIYGRRLSKTLSLLSKAQSSVQHQSIPKIAPLPPTIPRLALGVAGMATLQASLGISTLIYLVPIELASAHQAGSVMLLSLVAALLVSLRRPSSAARLLAERAKSADVGRAPLSHEAQSAIAARALQRLAKPKA